MTERDDAVITKPDAIEAATAVFRESFPHVAVREVTAFTRDDGASWAVRFSCEFRRDTANETGESVVVEWRESKTLFVDGETGDADWPRMS